MITSEPPPEHPVMCVIASVVTFAVVEHPVHGFLPSFTFPEVNPAPIALVGMSDDMLDRMAVEFTELIAKVKRRRAGLPEPETVTISNCPGCNRPLFADVAERGGCLACYPVLPLEGLPQATETEEPR